MNCIDESDSIILLPFRVAILGSMGSGKSNFIFNFILNIQKVTDIKKYGDNVEIIFCYSSPNSLYSMEQAAKETGILFTPCKLLPDLTKITEYQKSDNKRQLLIFFEDLQFNFSKLSLQQKKDFNTFILQSRHQNISTLITYHSFPYGSHNNELTSNYLKNATVIVIFQFLNDKRSMNLFANNLLGKDYSEMFKHFFEESVKLSSLDKSKPYVLIDTDTRKNISMSHRMRIDIFHRNLILNNDI